MATQHSANVYITNTSDGTAYVKLFHQNDPDGTLRVAIVAELAANTVAASIPAGTSCAAPRWSGRAGRPKCRPRTTGLLCRPCYASELTAAMPAPVPS
jgi:hypothetical protein